MQLLTGLTTKFFLFQNLVVVAMSSNDRLHLLNMTGSLKLRNAIKDAVAKSCIKIESEIEIRTKNNVQCLELKLEGECP